MSDFLDINGIIIRLDKIVRVSEIDYSDSGYNHSFKIYYDSDTYDYIANTDKDIIEKSKKFVIDKLSTLGNIHKLENIEL
jgi:hypothetical protein